MFTHGRAVQTSRGPVRVWDARRLHAAHSRAWNFEHLLKHSVCFTLSARSSSKRGAGKAKHQLAAPSLTDRTPENDSERAPWNQHLWLAQSHLSSRVKCFPALFYRGVRSPTVTSMKISHLVDKSTLCFCGTLILWEHFWLFPKRVSVDNQPGAQQTKRAGQSFKEMRCISRPCITTMKWALVTQPESMKKGLKGDKPSPALSSLS